MGVFGAIAIVPGWRFGWIAVTAPIFFTKLGFNFLSTTIILSNQILACPHNPEGSTFVMVQLNLSGFYDVVDDTDFCVKLAKEESMILLQGYAVGLKNWLLVSFAAEPKVLEDAIGRLKAFCLRHAKHH
ncbi:unnamed protein product [Lactuca saligna]|uniref:Aminotransferase class I/classII domain-containing protein n=1 Tax=Lactuca saligna TaxID=75948 RepID=A0AA35ZXQ9_LACSI|nr:unnamed protein product [Lactuca saligna]